VALFGQRPLQRFRKGKLGEGDRRLIIIRARPMRGSGFLLGAGLLHVGPRGQTALRGLWPRLKRLSFSYTTHCLQATPATGTRQMAKPAPRPKRKPKGRAVTRADVTAKARKPPVRRPV